ncbi:hypothetical protein BJX63DRAFT_407970 [Aspergillus granulosus]|uniref:Uncharacterized protein n=1 Tax=Aspergillus granulosus TaxID=176169 RepID=A0ABR4GZY2_9EURO
MWTWQSGLEEPWPSCLLQGFAILAPFCAFPRKFTPVNLGGFQTLYIGPRHHGEQSAKRQEIDLDLHYCLPFFQLDEAK